jgi:Kef-type K+ transport system membrane component KefB
MELRELLLGLAVIWIATRFAGELMERIGQPAVLGELLAGVLVGPGMFGLVHESEGLHALAELGVLILLFEVGLESDLSELLRAGVQSTVVAVVGVVVPFVGGFAVARAFDVPGLAAVIIGAALTATSVGITARVLADLGRLQDASGRIVLGAAVVDDVLGLLILSIVTGLVHSGGVAVADVAVLAVSAGAFLVVAIALGIRFAPFLVRLVGRLRARGSLIVSALIFAVGLAVIADALGLATIIGAFAAGLVLAKTEERTHIVDRNRPVADIFVPIFFATIGMKVRPADLSPFAPDAALGFALVLTAVAVVTKLSAGLGVYRRGARRWPVAVGMIPRGEVGLIFAGTGLATGVLTPALYSALVVMVMATTFAAPPWLKLLYRPR